MPATPCKTDLSMGPQAAMGWSNIRDRSGSCGVGGGLSRLVGLIPGRVSARLVSTSGRARVVRLGLGAAKPPKTSVRSDTRATMACTRCSRRRGDRGGIHSRPGS